MKYEKEDLELETGIQKDWVITNGIGGYSSSTILGINTRKYHGLLIAPLNPPGSRHLILSKLDESIETNGKKYNLYSNMGKEYISKGYQYLTKFEKQYIPIFTYEIEGIIIKKFICMEYGKNTVCVMYHIQNNSSRNKLTLAPVINFRDFHTTSENWDFDVKQEINKQKVKLTVNNQSQTPIYMHISEGTYQKHEHDIFQNMYYVEEEKRGLAAEENLTVPGVYEIKLRANEKKEITFICSLEENIEELNGKDLINKEIVRISGLLYDSGLVEDKQNQESNYQELMRDYIIAADNFVVYRPKFALYTIIAGYPWFLDWGRDTLIAYEGLVLLPKRYKIAQEILLTCIRDIKYGLVPNGYSGYDNRPLYNSADASLLLIEQVHKYLKYTQDYEFVKKNLYDTLIKIIESYITGIDLDGNNIHLDTQDGLLSSGTKEIQNTWMDAKIGDEVVTPRNGKTVEINSLWYNALWIMSELTKLYKDKDKTEKYIELAKQCQKSFEEKFYNKKKKCLYDVLGDSSVRPNQLFAVSLSHPILKPSSPIVAEILETVTRKLLTPYGLKTLAKGEKGYQEIYGGDVLKRDRSYHQGITWPWLLGLYADALQNRINDEKNKTQKKKLQEEYQSFASQIEKTFREEMYHRSTVGSISELYDSGKPYKANGSFAQAWSIAEVFRIIIREHE